MTESVTELVERIDNQANDIILNGGGDEELLLSLHDVMADLKIIMDASTEQELDLICQQYEGFYLYMRIIEQLAEKIADGTISVPK